MTTRAIRTQTELDGWGRFLANMPLPITVSVAKGVTRSGQQNRTAAKWYTQIGNEIGMTDIQVKALCKYTYGLPIMVLENAAWVAKWEPIYQPFDYARQLVLFECIPVTSEFTTKQMARYMDAVQVTYRSMGINLIDPDARKYA